MRAARTILPLLLLALSACSGAIAIDTALVRQNDELYAEFVRGDAAGITARLPSQYTATETAAAVLKARKLVPDGPAKSARVLGQHTFNSTGETQIQLLVGYDYPEKGVIFGTRWSRTDGAQPWSLIRVNVDSLADVERKAPTLAPAALPPLKPAN